MLVLALVLVPAPVAAEWQLRPFLGFAFGGDTTFIDFDRAAGKTHVVLGASGGWLGELLGFEGDLGFAPGFFEAGDVPLVLRSGVTTLTGNVVVALPRRLAQYSLRPYLVGGGGVMWVEIEQRFEGVLRVARTLPVVDVGGGVTGFLTDDIGLNWDFRYFRSAGGGGDASGVSFGAERLSFWRLSMAVAIRY